MGEALNMAAEVIKAVVSEEWIKNLKNEGEEEKRH